MANLNSTEDVYLDVLGQLPNLKIYTQICFCYPLADDASARSEILSTLGRGLEVLSASFPWVAGQVVHEGASEGNTGVFKIKPLEPSARLVVKDLRDDPAPTIPTMDALRKAKFPIDMLDEDIICPLRTIPTAEQLANALPVFVVQATFIPGGLILSFNAEHGTMDMTGQAQVIYLLSKACRNEPFTQEEVSTGNLDRRHLVPLLPDYTPGPELDFKLQKPAASQPAATTPTATPPKSRWVNLSFPASSLQALKSHAAQSLTSGFISTDDALTAFIWRLVVRARLARLPSTTTAAACTRAVDARPHLNVPVTYPGMLQDLTFHKKPVPDLAHGPLGDVAADLRAALVPADIAYNTRALATFLQNHPDKSTVSLAANLDLSVDLMLSSWARVDCYAFDFGFGLPEAVRRPRFVPFESLGYLLPKAPTGEIVVAICLREEDIGQLVADAEFCKYGVYVG